MTCRVPTCVRSAEKTRTTSRISRSKEGIDGKIRRFQYEYAKAALTNKGSKLGREWA